MVGHWGSSVGSYLAVPTSPIPSHCASIVATSTLRVKSLDYDMSTSDDLATRVTMNLLLKDGVTIFDGFSAFSVCVCFFRVVVTLALLITWASQLLISRTNAGIGTVLMK